jgi:hypothetical protein
VTHAEPVNGWIELDGAPAERGAQPGVRLDSGGLEQVVRGRRTRARWQDVLGVAQIDGRVYVLVPRRPPAPPWIEIDPRTLAPSAGSPRTAADVTDELRRRTQATGYRGATGTARTLLAPAELLARVKAREQIPGAVEVPVPSSDSLRHRTLEPLVGGAGAGTTALAVHPLLAELVGAQYVTMAAAGVALGTGLAIVTWRALRRPAPRPRVLVLCPDGCVVGFQDGVRALPWSAIERVESGIGAGPDAGPALVFRGVGHRAPLGFVEARWMDAPLQLVVSVAETYRARWSPRSEEPVALG